MAVRCFAFALMLCACSIGALADSYSFAVLSDIHIGDATGQLVVDLAEAAVEKINSIAAANNIKFVFVTGDLSNTALPWQFQEVRKILDGLQVPYIPSIGNHDIWSYNGTWEEPTPTGDHQFMEWFLDKWDYPNITKNNTCPTYNPVEKIYSCFQNWELRVGNMVFLSLDWNSRHHAVSQLGYKGSMPTADLHDFPGGTLPWLKERLSKAPPSTKSIVLLQHQPFRSPPIIPGFIYSFSEEHRLIVESVLRNGAPPEKIWGVLAGHYHIWSNGTAFNNWPEFIQWETDACKSASAISLVHVEDDRLVGFERLYGY